MVLHFPEFCQFFGNPNAKPFLHGDHHRVNRVIQYIAGLFIGQTLSAVFIGREQYKGRAVKSHAVGYIVAHLRFGFRIRLVLHGVRCMLSSISTGVWFVLFAVAGGEKQHHK